jgi:atypical dual specificity phosphatase
MQSFYWLIEDELAGCGRPGGRGRGLAWNSDAARAALEDDLAWLRARGIRAVLTLTEEPLADGALARNGLVGLHLPVRDMTAPTPAQLEAALDFIDRQRASRRPVAVHCLVGQGRSGTVLAAYLIRSGMTPEEALRRVRAVCPGAVENDEQQRALAAYAYRRDWIV